MHCFRLSNLNSCLHNSPGRIVRVHTPQALKLQRRQRKRQQSSSAASYLSSTKSSKHTIKIFLVSYLILKTHYILFFPPFVEVRGTFDYILTRLIKVQILVFMNNIKINMSIYIQIYWSKFFCVVTRKILKY